MPKMFVAIEFEMRHPQRDGSNIKCLGVSSSVQDLKEKVKKFMIKYFKENYAFSAITKEDKKDLVKIYLAFEKDLQATKPGEFFIFDGDLAIKIEKI